MLGFTSCESAPRRSVNGVIGQTPLFARKTVISPGTAAAASPTVRSPPADKTGYHEPEDR